MKETLEERFARICAKQPSALPMRYEDKSSAASWTIGRRKVFATWNKKGEQVGPHLRTNDEAVRSDARVKPTSIVTKRMEKTNNFVWLDPKKKWTDEELEALITASHTLSERKDGGIKRGGDFADLFIAVRKALVATPPEQRPPPPYHAGGPAAKILGNEAASSHALALWAARKIAPHGALPEEKAEVEQLMKLAGGAETTYSQLWAGTSESAGSRAMRAARAAKFARGSMSGGYATRASSYAADIILLVIEDMLEKKEKVTDFVAEVDDRVLIAEFSAVAYEKLSRDDVDCERVLWRGTDAKGNASRWIARLSKGKYAMIAKLGPRWEWVEGDRETVFASVPDADMEPATKVAFPRDVPGVFGPGAVAANPRRERRKKK